jgi:hypothetical protein
MASPRQIEVCRKLRLFAHCAENLSFLHTSCSTVWRRCTTERRVRPVAEPTATAGSTRTASCDAGTRIKSLRSRLTDQRRAPKTYAGAATRAPRNCAAPYRHHSAQKTDVPLRRPAGSAIGQPSACVAATPQPLRGSRRSRRALKSCAAPYRTRGGPCTAVPRRRSRRARRTRPGHGLWRAELLRPAPGGAHRGRCGPSSARRAVGARGAGAERLRVAVSHARGPSSPKKGVPAETTVSTRTTKRRCRISE